MTINVISLLAVQHLFCGRVRGEIIPVVEKRLWEKVFRLAAQAQGVVGKGE